MKNCIIISASSDIGIDLCKSWSEKGWNLFGTFRKKTKQVIDLTKKLISDPNYYVVQMACFALAQILRNRLTVLPSNRDTLFFNYCHILFTDECFLFFRSFASFTNFEIKKLIIIRNY